MVTTFSGAPSPDERLALYLAREQAAGWKHTSLGHALVTLWNRLSAIDGQAALFPVESTPWIATVSPSRSVRFNRCRTADFSPTNTP